jgi:Flp pilus assembly protein TadG
MNRIRKNALQRRGAVIVEFALTAPILLMLVIGAIEFSRANMLYNTVGIAATEGARAGITSGATAAEVRSAVQRELDILGIQESTIAVDPPVITDNTALVAVGITVPVSARNSYLLPRFFMGRSISKVVVLQREAATSNSQRANANSADAIGRVTAAMRSGS